MKLLYFMVLLNFGAIPDDGSNISREQAERKPTCNVTKCVRDEIFTSSNSNVLEIKHMCTELLASNNTDTNIYNRAERMYMDSISLPFDGETKTYALEDFNIQISARKLSDDDPPFHVLMPTEHFLNVPEEQLKNDLYPVVESEAIHVETVRHEMKNLSSQLVVNFTVNSHEIIPGNDTLSFQFCDKTEDDWNDMGSFTNLENSSNTVNGSHDHMTPYSVLLGNMSQIENLEQKNQSSISYLANRTENYFFYNSTELVFAESLNKSFCNWGDSRCYVECTYFNLTTNITGANIIMDLVQNNTITGQNKTQLVFNTGDTNTTCNVTKCESDEMNAFIPNMDLIRLKQVQHMCNKSFASDTYIRAEKEYIDQHINLEFDGPNKTYEHEDFNMTVVKMDKMNTRDHGRVTISAPKVSDDDPPIEVFIPTEPFLNVSLEQRKVGVLTYRSAQQFTNDPNIVLMSKVIRVETVGYEIKNLSNRLVINFPVNSSEIKPGNHNLSCQFYDESEHKWDDMGSFTNLSHFNSSNIVTCSYDHMTPFAVLLVYVAQPDQQQQKNLPCISYPANRTGNYFFYNSTELVFTKSLNKSFCNWGDSRCYVECTYFNLTTNITGANIIMDLVQNNTITGQNKTQLVFNTGDTNTTCNVTKCESDEMNAFIPNMDLIRLKQVQHMCNKSFASDTYIRAEKEYIDQHINLEFDGPNKTYEHEDFNMIAVKMDMMNTRDHGCVKISAPKLSDDDPAIDVFFPVQIFLNGPGNQHKVGVVTYHSSQQFLNNSYPVLKSKVIRIETAGRKRKNLSTRLVINFTVNSSEIKPGNHNLSCQFYNETEHKWDDMGSFTNLENFNSSNIVTCSYDHMAPFAVLLVYVAQPDQQQQKNLPCISYPVNRTENYFFYNSTELVFTKSLNKSFCNWGDSRCYVECTYFNLTTNITGANIIMDLVQNDTITGQNKTQLVFNTGDTNTTCNVTKCESDEMNAFIPNMDLIRLKQVQHMCNKSFASDTYIRAEKEYIDQHINLEFDGPNKTYEHEDFNMIAVKMDMMNTRDHGCVKISAPKLSDDDPAIDVFFPVQIFLNGPGNQHKVGVVTYHSSQQFLNNSYPVLKSKVIRIETAGRERKNLSTRLVINFTVNSSEIKPGNHNLSCQFYNETEHKWDDMGSFTNLENFNSSNTVTCSYDHMAPFAVLLVYVAQPDQQQQKNLPCISYPVNRTENYFFYNSTELVFTKSLNKSFCNWGDSRCYVECTYFNLTTNITGANIIMDLVQNDTITGQNKTQLVFNTGDTNTTCNVTKCESDEMNAFIPNMDLIRLKQVQHMCNKSFASDTYIRAEKEYIDQHINLEFDGPNKTYEYDNFKMTVFNITMMNNGDQEHVTISAPKLSDDDPAIDVFFPVQIFLNGPGNQHKVGVVTYHSSQQFLNNSYPVLKSKVIRVETVGYEIKNLSNQLVINFPVNSSEIKPATHKPSCQFYNETEHKWDDMGSFTNLSNFNSLNIVTCSYNHMTPFAVLLKQKNQSCMGYKARWTTISFYKSTELEISENLTKLLCNWGDSRCYVECTYFNLTTNITGANNIMGQVQNDTITGQNKTQLVFNTGGQDITCNVTKCVLGEISALIIQSVSSADLKDLTRLTQIKKMCNELFTSDRNLKHIYISAEKNYIHSLINLPFNGTKKNYVLEEFNMTVVKMDMMNTTVDRLAQISAPKVADDDLPVDVFVPVDPFLNVSKEQCKVAVVTYNSAEQFMNDLYIGFEARVLRIETFGRALKNLSPKLVIAFTVNSSEMIPENHKLSCQFYDETEHKWDDKGSFTNLSNNNTVTCSYDHMTPFAVLLVDMNVLQINPQQWKILSYVSYIGCSLSSFFSTVTIFLYIFMKRPDINNSIRIHVSLSVALFLLNTSFLLIEWGATWSQDAVCIIIAVIIQYSLLSCFSWMAIEAIHLYLLLIKVFNTYIKHYMVKLSLFGWGLPAVLVGGSLCAYGSKPFFGKTQIKLSNMTEATSFCWITDPHYLYGMNITYFCLTFLFNTCVLVAVTHQIFKMRCLNIRGSGRIPSRKDICTVLGLSFLLGMTWGLAFFTSGYTNYPILYLFCICNTLQGLFHFLWSYSAMKKNRSLVAQASVAYTVSDPVSTSVKR
ncbi:uncharacterized protein LOC108271069 isoform X2 [Ictalurus punctatus]|uniref:Uncharacterized protein LOC108271069 isoform X2 n=1 Tax=Ictalurus punctatus TaxID=7998 RepID=A0A9F7TN86_ICTPU|nr:uncharacterized protein LOC108271069 isoform X2 [Ictalurus punctatus]